MSSQTDGFFGDLRRYVAYVVGTAAVMFVLSRLFIGWHAFWHTSAKLPDIMEIGNVCRKNPVLEKNVAMAHECEHLRLVGEWSPFEQALVAMYADTVSIFTSMLAIAALALFLTAFVCANSLGASVRKILPNLPEPENGVVYGVVDKELMDPLKFAKPTSNFDYAEKSKYL